MFRSPVIAIAAVVLSVQAPVGATGIVVQQPPSLEGGLPINCPQPPYPVEALRYELEGETIAEFLVDEAGRATDNRIFKSSGWTILDDAVLATMGACRFSPVTMDGKIVRGQWRKISYLWTLRDPGEPRSALPVVLPGPCASSSRLAFTNDPFNSRGVLLRFLISPTGTVSGIKFGRRSENVAVNDAAMELLQGCRFQPRMSAGLAVPSNGFATYQEFEPMPVRNPDARRLEMPSLEASLDALTMFPHGELFEIGLMRHPTSGWTLTEQFELYKAVLAGDPQALADLKQQAEFGLHWAQRALAKLHEETDLLGPSDPVKAFRLYKAVAERGDIAAQYKLAYLYWHGIGVVKDLTQARVWLEKAVTDGAGGLENELGEMYRDGVGGPVREDAALKLFTRASEHQNGSAMLNLAVVYGKGQGTVPDPEKAYQYLLLANQKVGAAGKFADEVKVAMDAVLRQLSDKERSAGKELADRWLNQHPPKIVRFPDAAIGPRVASSRPCAGPVHPVESKARGETGTVVMALQIGADGKVIGDAIKQSSGFRALDQAALAAVRACEFTPALKRGLPVVGSKEMRWEFK